MKTSAPAALAAVLIALSGPALARGHGGHHGGHHTTHYAHAAPHTTHTTRVATARFYDAPRRSTVAPAPKVYSYGPVADGTCYTGPRGGHYRIVNGVKRYGC